MSALPNYIAYVGCYSKLDGGIHVLEINPNNGEFKRVAIAKGIADPTFLCLTKDNSKLYAGVCEIAGVADKGGVAMFNVNGTSLTFSSFQKSGGTKPCYVALDNDEKALFAANYSEGTGAYFKLDAKGDVFPEAKHFDHAGLPLGPNKRRQEKAHVHCSEVSPDGKFLYFVDLGIDTVKAYNYDNGKGDLSPVPAADIKAEAGQGPRHLLFTQQGKFAYVINELGSTVTVYAREGIGYKAIQTMSLLPPNYAKAAANTASAVKITADGTRLLCSNRGYDSIAVFDVNPATGLLKLLAINPTMGRGPRDFALMPGDKFVLVAHQYTDNVICFAMDYATGAFTPVGDQILVPQGVCIKIGAPINK